MMPAVGKLPTIFSVTVNMLIICGLSFGHIRLYGPDKKRERELCPCFSPRGRIKKQAEVGSREGRCYDSHAVDLLGSPSGCV